MEDKWVYPPIDEALEKARWFSMGHYANVGQNTLAESIATCRILELCRGSEHESGSNSRSCWTGGHKVDSKVVLTKWFSIGGLGDSAASDNLDLVEIVIQLDTGDS